MRIPFLSRVIGASLVIAVLGACDSAVPTAANLPPRASTDLTLDPNAPVSDQPNREFVRVCKVGSDATIRVTDDEPVVGGTVDVAIPDGECRQVSDFSVGNVTVTLQEIAVESGFQLDSIVATVYSFPGPTSVKTVLTATDTYSFTSNADIAIAQETAVVVKFYNSLIPTGNQGCTPGYWKQPHHFDSWGDYAPTDGFNATFGLGTNWFPNSLTLAEALALGGGGVNALARHAVAALLNADQGFYPLSEAQVIAAVLAAYNGADVEDTKDVFADYNELGCPLN